MVRLIFSFRLSDTKIMWYVLLMQNTLTESAAVLNQLTSTLAASLSPNPTTLYDPAVQNLLNSHTLCNQYAFAESLLQRAEATPENPAYTQMVVRTFNIMERTTSRIARANPDSGPFINTSERQEAREFLLTELADGPRPAKQVLAAANAAAISRRTLFRAKSELNIQSIQSQPPGQSRIWSWVLPTQPVVQPIPSSADHTQPHESSQP